MLQMGRKHKKNRSKGNKCQHRSCRDFAGDNTGVPFIKRFDIEITDAAKEVMVKEGYDPVYGARPLKRYIGNTLETMIARRLIAGEIYNGCTIVVDGEDDNISIKVK